jgi:hypothetical protein
MATVLTLTLLSVWYERPLRSSLLRRSFLNKEVIHFVGA